MAVACSLSNFKFNNTTIIPVVAVDATMTDSRWVIELIERQTGTKGAAVKKCSQDFLASIKDLSVNKAEHRRMKVAEMTIYHHYNSGALIVALIMIMLPVVACLRHYNNNRGANFTPKIVSVENILYY
jgi:hypothetical protein